MVMVIIWVDVSETPETSETQKHVTPRPCVGHGSAVPRVCVRMQGVGGARPSDPGYKPGRRSHVRAQLFLEKYMLKS